ncbi:MAG: class I SAM-dependent methyltransferase [Erythrobacter sp.]
MAGDTHAAWNEFWALNKSSGQDGGCLPAGYQGINGAQSAAWAAFAKTLPKNARVLDLATGDGRVMAWLLGARRDLKVSGCDMAPELPQPPRGTKVKGGVRMEALPYPDKQFACITSQFGFEYGDTPKAAAEAARVLRDDGVLTILTHRQDGPILAHNLKRRAQIKWAIEEQGLAELAKRSLQMRSAGLAVVPDTITNAPAKGAAAHGAQSAAWEIAEAIRQSLVMGARDHPANVARLIDTIVSRAHNELGRIASLEAACATTANEASFAAALADAGFDEQSNEPVTETGQTAPFADFRTYRINR